MLVVVWGLLFVVLLMFAICCLLCFLWLVACLLFDENSRGLLCALRCLSSVGFCCGVIVVGCLLLVAR